jgi:tetratricopeptide (TPR) repeat protein/serine phosphatase RsbU (regulator of sigma subunit)
LVLLISLTGKIHTRYLFFACLVTSLCISQGRKIDSLRAIYFSAAHDTIKLQALNNLIWPLYSNSQPDSGIKYGHIAIELANKTKSLSKLMVTCRRLAICYTNIGDHKNGLKYHSQSLDIAKQLKSDKDIGIAIGNLGVVYMDIGDQTRALDYNLQSIALKEKSKNDATVQNNYYNIGIIYKDLLELDKALEAMLKSVEISKRTKDQTTLGTGYNGLGLVYKSRKEYDKAKYYYNLSIETNLQNQNYRELADAYVSLGTLYSHLKNYDSAVQVIQTGIEVYRKINYKVGLSGALANLAFCYNKLKQYTKAINAGEESILSNQGSLGNMEYVSEILAEAYYNLKDFKEAYRFMNLRFRLNDSLTKINTSRDIIRLELRHDFDKKLLADSIKFAEQDKINLAKVEVANARLDKEKTARYALIFGLIALVVFSYFIFTRFRLIKKQNIIIGHQRAETEKQKRLIEEKQKEILDSINYAKRIQYALLASDDLLNANFPEHFVFFKPKDVVSGDFYWATHSPEGFIYITADCTGHGVPGAFMSLLNISKLSQTINEQRIYAPDRVLNNVRTEIIAALNPAGWTEESKDGMDAVLCKLDLKKMKLQFSAANNSFYICRNNEFIICKADKLSVGKGHNDAQSFTFNEVDLKKGDIIYTFTDGYADQFGGPLGKKFKYKQLEDLLLANSEKSMTEQKTILDNSFNAWKGSLDQVDDVCVIGVRV